MHIFYLVVVIEIASHIVQPLDETILILPYLSTMYHLERLSRIEYRRCFHQYNFYGGQYFSDLILLLLVVKFVIGRPTNTEIGILR